MNVTICKSCRIGNGGISEEEIKQQENKNNGIYICKDCEKAIEGIANAEFGEIKNSNGKNCLVTKDGIYVDCGMKSRNEKHLGYGGRLFMIIETRGKYLKKKKVYLTNNLFNIMSIHPSMIDKYKHNINAEIISVDWDNFDILKEQLDKIN